ncbi:hypothetical protein [Nonomuraea maritima]|uniref:hypothetical protein n=1 Tax=Nonomuraea maritima TaxID=683260 RepID=UPI003716D6DD
MTGALSAADINSYLAATGWSRRPESWRGAAVWDHGGGHELLVPEKPDLVDAPRRIRELVAVLARVEERSREEIAADIGAPMADVHWYRSPVVPPGGRAGLLDAAAALGGVQTVLGAAARAAFDGPRPVFEGAPPRAVRELLGRVWIGPSDLLTVRVPVHDDELGRRTLILLRRATLLLREAVAEMDATGDIAVFDRLVGEGVSADLCAALARFAGSDAEAPFEVGFRWARGLPSAVPAGSVVFPAGTGLLLRRVAHRLRRLHQTGLIGEDPSPGFDPVTREI